MNLKIPLGILVLGLVLSIGIIIGHYGIKSNKKVNVEYYQSLISELDIKQGQDLLDKEIDKNNIRNHLKYLTSIGHMAGTTGDKLSADYVRNQWISQELDYAELIDYDVLLDFPDDNKYNNFQILNANSEVEQTYEVVEPTYDAGLNYSQIPKPFLAYAKSGSVKSEELIFVNYCIEDDFEHLKSLNIFVKNKIVICKYGKVFRGNKVQIAEIYGAIGVLLYDDPQRAAPKIAKDKVYPYGEFLPGKGTQRGSLYTKNGDLYTPSYPSNDYAYRNKSYDADLPNIPAQVIGYNDAYVLFKLIESNYNQVRDDWKGEFNLTYTYGGKLDNNRKIRLNVYNQRKVAKTYNVIGCIKGELEPDRYVALGNHRDAWSFGSLDPSSGTSVMLEVSRALANLKKNKNWKPKRSILFLSWGAEEYGLIGSFEWVEEYQKKLKANGIAYINLDTIAKGNYSYDASASPLLYDFLFDVTKSIQVTNTESVYDRWLKNDPNKDKNEPNLSPFLGAGSDHAALLNWLDCHVLIKRIQEKEYILILLENMPCVNLVLKTKKNPLYANLGLSSYPTYHSSYETFDLIEKYLDPNFETFRIIAMISGELIRRLSDSLILPFNCKRYAQVLNEEYSIFKRQYEDHFRKLDIDLKHLEKALSEFTQEADSFHKRLNKINKNHYHLIRAYNEQLRNIEKAFLDTTIGVKRMGFEHMIFSPSIFNQYGSDFFPSVEDAFYNYFKNPNSSALIEDLKFQLSVVTFSIQSAKSILKEPIDFDR